MKFKTPIGTVGEIPDEKVELSFRYAQAVAAALGATARVAMIERDEWRDDFTVSDSDSQAMFAACMLTLQHLAQQRDMTPSQLVAAVATSIGGERAMLLLLQAEREVVLAFARARKKGGAA